MDTTKHLIIINLGFHKQQHMGILEFPIEMECVIFQEYHLLRRPETKLYLFQTTPAIHHQSNWEQMFKISNYLYI